MPYAGMFTQRNSTGLWQLAFLWLQRPTLSVYEEKVFKLLWWAIYRCLLTLDICLKVNYVFNAFHCINK